jgi:hypothetical protein
LTRAYTRLKLRSILFSAAMLGQLEVVKAFVAAQPGAQHIRGPHSISLLAHARRAEKRRVPFLSFCNLLETPTLFRRSRSRRVTPMR